MKRMGETARIISPIFDKNMSQGCLRVGVFMFGVDVGNLTIGQFSEENPSDIAIIGTLIGNFGNSWQIFMVNLQQSSERFQLFIEASIGASYLSDIALDSLELLEKSRCTKDLKTYKEPQRKDLPRINVSPTSCQQRCEVNVTTLLSEQSWMEGVCQCSREECSRPDTKTCCVDYESTCEISPGSQQFSDKSSWLENIWIKAVLACVGAIISMIITAIVIVRLRSSSNILRRISNTDDEDGAKIMEEEEDKRAAPDMEEFIDFTLATACQVDGPNSQWCQTTVSLSNRRVTSI